MKLGCDGSRPCNTCSYKGIECTYSRLQSKLVTPRQEESPAAPKSWQESTTAPSSERGSIQFLLNSGTASFIECFRFPPPTEKRDIFNLRNSSNNLRSPNFFGNGMENANAYPEAMEPGKQVDWPVMQEDSLSRFMTHPVPDVPLPADVFTPLFMDPNFAHAGPVSGTLCPEEWEPASVQSAAILQGLLGKSALLNLNDQEQADISQHLNYLIVPSKIEKSINCYFEFWHQHCPMVHRPSFSIDTAPVPLLISMTLMGAMYSQTDHEVSSAKVALDLAELFIYGLDDFTDEYEIQQMLKFSATPTQTGASTTSYVALKNLQAAYLMIVVQTWAGNTAARKRSIETRFSTVIKVARRLGLTKARHDFRDSHDENLWIQKESQIRLINAMTLLDSAFVFFSNFPSRLSVTEMKFDLHSEESFFASMHPLSEPSFHSSRQLTVYEAFRSLFSKEKLEQSDGTTNNPLGLGVVDMFTLIHLLYVYTHTQISLFSSLAFRSPNSSGSSTPNAPIHDPSSDSNIALIKTALSRWRALWIAIRANTPENAWVKMGFFRNGYNYWLVTQLLVTNKGSADVILGMEVNCDDTLMQLQSLLKDGGADI